MKSQLAPTSPLQTHSHTFWSLCIRKKQIYPTPALDLRAAWRWSFTWLLSVKKRWRAFEQANHAKGIRFICWGRTEVPWELLGGFTCSNMKMGYSQGWSASAKQVYIKKKRKLSNCSQWYNNFIAESIPFTFLIKHTKNLFFMKNSHLLNFSYIF